MNNLKPKLRIHPIPYVGESIAGFALRVAVENGWNNINEMFGDMGTPSRFDMTNASPIVIKNLSLLVGHSSELINDMSAKKSLLKPHLINHLRCFTHIIDKNPKICSFCISENGYIKTDWAMIGFDYCLSHGAVLIKKCPSCNEAFKWDASLFNSNCYHCNNILSSPVLSNPSGYISDFISKTHELRNDLLNDIFITSQRILRPYDSIIEISKWPYEYPDWGSVLDKAYMLLTDEKTAISWQQECIEARKQIQGLGSAALILPFTSLISSLKLDWPILHYGISVSLNSNTEISAEYDIQLKSQVRIKHTFTSDRWRFHCDLNQLCDTLGIYNFDTIHQLVKIGAITPIKESIIFKNTLFSLDHISFTFTVKRKIYSEHELITFDDYAYLLPLFGVQITDWINWFYIKSLKANLDSEQHTFKESISPTKNSLQCHLILSLRKLQTSSVSITEVSEMFNISLTDIRDLHDSSNIKIFHLHSQAHITGKDIITLLQNFVIIPWIAACLRTSPAEIIRVFEKKGINVVLGKSFILQSTEAINILCELLGRDSLLINRHGKPIWLQKFNTKSS